MEYAMKGGYQDTVDLACMPTRTIWSIRSFQTLELCLMLMSNKPLQQVSYVHVHITDMSISIKGPGN